MTFVRQYSTMLCFTLTWIDVLCYNAPRYQYSPSHFLPQYMSHPFLRIPENIPSDAHHVKIYYNNISIIKPGPFAHLNNCISLDLKWNKISELQMKSFEGMTKLEELLLSANEIEQLDAYTFHGLLTLKQLHISNNKLTHIDPNAFCSLKVLQYLDLSQNHLTQIYNGTLSPLESLSSLVLTENLKFIFNEDTWKTVANLSRLFVTRSKRGKCNFQCSNQKDTHTIPETSLKELKALTVLILNTFGIVKLHEDTFKNQFELQTLYLGCNFIANLPDGVFSNLQKLKFLDISHNCLSSVDIHTFPNLINLKTVYLHSNQIVSVDKFAFANNLELQSIYLQKNNLSYIYKDVFQHLPLKHLDLSSNKIHTIEPGSFPRFQSGQLVLCQNLLSSLEWNIFLNRNMGQIDIQNKIIGLNLDGNFTTSSRQNCWLFDGIDAGWITLYVPGTKGPQQIPPEYKSVCPRNESCMANDTARCMSLCKSQGYHSGLVELDYHVCPFQYHCNCTQETAEWTNVSQNIRNKTANVSQNIRNITDDVTKADDSNWSEALIAQVVSTAGLVVLAAAILLCIRKKKRHPEEIVENKLEETVVEDTELKAVQQLVPELADEIRKCWIQPRRITTEHLTVKGNFGDVWSGTLKRTELRKMSVTVKQVRENVNSQSVKDFLKESVIVRRFNHPNVLPVIGISRHKGSPCAVLPLMTNGDLKTYLRKKDSTLTIPRLLTFASGVAKGMEYLAEQKFVHRDLAARNCVVNGKLLVKISDFGLARDMHESDYYRVGDQNKGLPVRWMSLEAMQDGIFTTQSDVWSFGVVLWEIFTKGRQPYLGVCTENIEDYVRKGNKLSKPKLAPQYIYHMMLKCWNIKPNERPNFIDIATELESHTETEAGYTTVFNQSGNVD